MKKGIIFLTVSVIIAVFAMFSVLLKGINRVSNEDQKDEKYDAFASIDSFDFKALSEEIKNSSYITSLVFPNGKISAKIDGNTLNVNITSSGLKYSCKFTYEAETLYADLFNINKLDEITYHIFDLAYSLKYIDEDDMISNYIINGKNNYYNLEKLGLEIKNDMILMKTDRKIEFENFKNQYITEEFAKKNKSKLDAERLIKFGNETVKVIKTGTKEFMIISISEKNNITENAFKSLINILGVVLEYNEVYENFINSHLDMKFNGEKKADYLLEINPEKEEYEKQYFEEEPMIRFTFYGK